MSFRRMPLFLVAVLSGLGSTAVADSGPDAYGYRAMTVPYAFVDIKGAPGTVRTLYGVDDASYRVDLPFAFNFYGRDYSSLVFYSSNALITFGTSDSAYTNADLTATVPGGVDVPTIAVLWDDWTFSPSGTDAVYYNTLGIPGDRRLVIQWNQAVHYSSCPSTVTFEAILYEGSNDIRFNYLDATTGYSVYDNGASATVGIRDTGGQANGRRLQWSYNQPVIADGSSILFTTVPAPGAALLGIVGCGLIGWVKRRMA